MWGDITRRCGVQFQFECSRRRKVKFRTVISTIDNELPRCKLLKILNRLSLIRCQSEMLYLCFSYRLVFLEKDGTCIIFQIGLQAHYISFIETSLSAPSHPPSIIPLFSFLNFFYERERKKSEWG